MEPQYTPSIRPEPSTNEIQRLPSPDLGSQLPLEIIIQILAFATAELDPFHQPRMVPRGSNPYTLPERAIRRHRESLATKHVLVQVCRLWNELAIEALYEHVLVREQRQLDALVETLYRRRGPPLSFRQAGDRTLGSFIKRLDALLLGVDWAIDQDGGDKFRHIDALERTVQATPNLHTLIIDGVYSLSLKATSTTRTFSLSTLPSTIRFLSTGNWTLSDPMELAKVLRSQSSLRVLDCPGSIEWTAPFRQRARESLGSSTTVYPSIQEIVCRFQYFTPEILSRIPAASLPNLERLVLLKPPFPSHGNDALPVHGENLTSLHVVLRGRARKKDTIYRWLDRIQEFCPKLREFEVTAYNCDRRTRIEPRRLPGITTFGIQLWYHSEPSDDPYDDDVGLVKELIADVKFFAPDFPKLRTVRLMDEENVLALLDPSIGGALFDVLLKDFRDRGINVVDNFGVCLN